MGDAGSPGGGGFPLGLPPGDGRVATDGSGGSSPFPYQHLESEPWLKVGQELSPQDRPRTAGSLRQGLGGEQGKSPHTQRSWRWVTNLAVSLLVLPEGM